MKNKSGIAIVKTGTYIYISKCKLIGYERINPDFGGGNFYTFGMWKQQSLEK
jgi:hypothetical protein